ncbi:MAG TPA: MYXO-CTERM sorting domain-containing protein [Kofleriaceae bacterium]|nr:MYXO-CTERM sorting domain-containing protein [Kofleriaceae bacterium]
MSRIQLAGAIALAAMCASAGAARASDDSAELLTGQVVSAQSRWARGGTAIVTDSLLRLDDGREVAVRQLGGTVDGIGMVTIPGPALLRAGDRVSAEVVIGRDLGGRESRLVQRLWVAPEPGQSGGGRIPFVQTVATRTRVPLAWESGCARVTFHADGTTHVAGDGEFAEMEAALARWMDATAGCSYLELRLTEPRRSEVGLDGTNLVIYREERWCRPATDGDPEECYDRSAAGLTTLFFIDDSDSDRNGAILDADVELNAVDFAIARDGETTHPERCASEIDNTFTHEIGHLMGLDHTCFAGGERLTDDGGDPQPNCDPVAALSEEQREATMYNFQDCGERKKATPEPDDVDGVCGIYPVAADPGECSSPELEDKGCCAVAGSQSSPASALPLIALAALALLWLRRRQGTSL